MLDRVGILAAHEHESAGKLPHSNCRSTGDQRVVPLYFLPTKCVRKCSQRAF